MKWRVILQDPLDATHLIDAVVEAEGPGDAQEIVTQGYGERYNYPEGTQIPLVALWVIFEGVDVVPQEGYTDLKAFR